MSLTAVGAGLVATRHAYGAMAFSDGRQLVRLAATLPAESVGGCRLTTTPLPQTISGFNAV